MPRSPTALALVLLVAVWAAAAPPTAAGHSKKKDVITTEEPASEETPHHKPFELRHFHHHHRHYHHYRDPSKHWVAGLLLALVGFVLASCTAVGLWRRFCARRPSVLHLGAACPPFERLAAVDAPLLQPPPMPLSSSRDKEAPPPYKETWT